jgi:lysine 6-dehydrogenase
MKAILIGAGRMAEAVLHDFVAGGEYERITAADVDVARASQLAEARGSGITRAAAVDASDEQAVARLVAGHDVCVSAAPYRYNVALARAAIAAGAHFVDMGGNNDVVAAELALDGEAKAAGVAVVPDLGLAPGMTNVLAASLVGRLDEPEALHLRVGGLPQRPEPPLNYALVFSPYGLINEYAEPCLALRGGEVVTLPPLTEVETLEVAPLGRLEAFHTSGGASTLPRTYCGRLAELDYKTIRYPGHCAAIKPLFDLGLASEEEVTVGEVKVKPRDLFAERLVTALPEGRDDLVVVRCRAAGRRAGELKTASYELIDYADAATGLTAMQRTTGFPVAVVASFLASGRIKKAGAFPPEVIVEPGPFVEALRARGLDLRESET